MDVTGQMKIKLVHGNNLEGNTLNLQESELLSQSGKKHLRVTSTSGSSFYPKGGTLQSGFTESEKSGKNLEPDWADGHKQTHSSSAETQWPEESCWKWSLSRVWNQKTKAYLDKSDGGGGLALSQWGWSDTGNHHIFAILRPK